MVVYNKPFYNRLCAYTILGNALCFMIMVIVYYLSDYHEFLLITRFVINIGDDIAATSDVITLNYFRSEKESM